MHPFGMLQAAFDLALALDLVVDLRVRDGNPLTRLLGHGQKQRSRLCAKYDSPPGRPQSVKPDFEIEKRRKKK